MPPLPARRIARALLQVRPLLGRRTRRRATLAGLALVSAGAAPVLLAPAASAAVTFSLSANGPATVLYGSAATESLTASAPAGSQSAYNLSFEDVLPAGVSYVAGTTTPATVGDPEILTDEPSTGETTLIWANVADLQPASTFSLGFNVQGALDTTVPTPSTVLLPGDTFTTDASAYVSSDPRYVPAFSATGASTGGATIVGEGPMGATTEISPLQTTLTDPLPEGELMRGVHDQQKVWTLTVTNNKVHATDLSAIEAWLPAGLEFLGCGGVDNTATATATDAGASGPAPYPEYPGAPPLSAGTTLAASSAAAAHESGAQDCATPTSVTTEDTVTPPNLTGSSNEGNKVYTDVVWTFGSATGDLAATTLAPGASYTIRYLAAVPLRENAMTFLGGTPSAADAEMANLDNNTRASTLLLSTGSGSDQTSAAQATGTYSGTFGSGSNPVIAVGTDTVSVHDIAIQKSVSSGSFVEGNVVSFTLHYETSEYRYATGTTITDTVANGLCPLDPGQNYDQSASGTNHSECGSGGVAPTIPFSSVSENTAAVAGPPAAAVGGFTLTWNLSTLAPNTDTTLTYDALDRAFYQQYSGAAFSAAAPTLTGDSLAAGVEIAAATEATCVDGGTTADPTCTGGASSAAIDPTDEPAATAASETNPSAAGQSAGQPSITKTIAAPISDGHGGVTCTGASYSTSTALSFQDGDLACFQLTVSFPAGLYTRDPVVEDYLPPNSTYVGTGVDGSGPVAPTNTVTIPATVPGSTEAANNGDSAGAANPVVTQTGDGDLVRFYLGASVPSSGTTSIYASPGDVFSYDIGAVLTGAPTAGNTFNLTQNLMKFTSFNSPGAATANRNDATYTVEAPSLTLLKGVQSTGSTTSASGNVATTSGSTSGTSFDSNIDNVQVTDGGNAVFRVDIANPSAVVAYDPTVWDVLSSGQSCADTTAISNSGTCYSTGSAAPTGLGTTANVSAPTIVWTGSDLASVPAESGNTPGEATLTYQYDVPSGAATGDIFNDTAGIVSYIGEPNTAGGSATSPNDITYLVDTTGSNVATSDGYSLPTLGTNQAAAPTPTAGSEEDLSKVFVHVPLLTKAVSPSTQTIGGVVKFTLTATSPAGGALYNGVVSDPLGSAFTYDATGPDGAATASCSGGASGSAALDLTSVSTDTVSGFTLKESANTITLDWPTTVAAAGTNAVCTVTFDATVADVSANKRAAKAKNTASFAYNNEASGAGTGAPITASASVTIAEPDVALTKTDNAPGHVATPGGTVQYTLTVTNTSTTDVSAANDVVVTDCVESGATYVAGSSSATFPGQASPATADPTVSTSGVGSCASGNDALSWNLNTLFGSTLSLSAGGAATITFSTKIPTQPIGTDQYPDAAAVSVTSLDTTASPGARTASTASSESIAGYSASATDTVSVPGTQITKSPATATAPVGVDTTYTLTVTIPADLSFPDLTAVDVLPNGMTFDQYLTATCTDTTTNSACTPDSGGTAITTETPTTDTTADASTGETAAAWWIGNVAASSDPRQVTLTYAAYPSEKYQSGASVNAGASLTNTVDTYWNDATGAASATAPTPGSGTNFGFNHASASATATLTVLAPSLSIQKTTTVTNPVPGETIPYAVTVTNATANAATAELTQLTDAVPALLVVDPASISDGGVLAGTNADGSGGTITWDLTTPSEVTLGPGASLTRTFNAQLAPAGDFTVADAGSAIRNTATAATYYAVTPATATGDPTRYDAYPAVSAHVDVTPVFPGLSVAKYTGSTGTATSGTTDVGVATAFHLAVTDTTAAPASALQVVDTLPAGWSYDAGSSALTLADGTTATTDPTTHTSGSVETLTWSGLGALATGQSITIGYSATPSASAGLDVTDTNTAVASGTDATGATGIGSGGGFTPYDSNTASASETIPQAHLELTKTNAAAFPSGGQGTYTLSVKNAGPDAAAEPITVSDPLPSGESFVSASGTGWNCPTPAAPSDPVVCTYGTAGSSVPANTTLANIDLTVAVADAITPGVAAVTNTATATANHTYNPGTGSGSDATTVVGADLTISKTDGGLTAGADGQYTLTVKNLGSADSVASAAAPITVTDTLPGGETLGTGGATGVGWSCNASGQTITCTDQTTIVSGASAPSITVPVVLASSLTGPITNTATVTPGLTDDPNSANNTATDTTTVTTAADLNVAKTLTSGTIVAGEQATYTIAVNNLGPSDALAPEVRDVLPAGESFVSASGTDWSCANAAGTVTCDYAAAATLPVGTAASPITLTVAVSSAATSAITNTAEVCSGTIGTGANSCGSGLVANGTSDPVTANNSSSAAGSPAVSADLSLAKTHSGSFLADGQGTYVLTVTNHGHADSVGTNAQPIVVSDTLPSGESYASAQGTGWSCHDAANIVTCDYASTIVAGTSAPTITLTVGLSTFGSVTNHAEVTPGATPDPNMANNTAADTTTIAGADLSVSKTHSGDFTAGADGTYTIVAANAGPAAAGGPVTVLDTLPVGESFVSATGTGWNCTDGAGTGAALVSCVASSGIGSGATMPPITLTVLVAPDATGTLTNVAQIYSSGTPDPSSANNTASDPTAIVAAADLSIEKTHTGRFVAGGDGDYTLAVANLGPSEAAGPITITDPLPAGETYVGATGSGWSCAATPAPSTVTCSLPGSLAPGASAPVVSLVVGLGAATVPTVTNTASVSSPTPDPAPADNSSSDTASPVPSSGLGVDKSLVGTLVSGASAHYRIVVTNYGPSAASDVVMTDVLPAGLSAPAASGDGWSCDASASAVVCSAASLALGAAPAIALSATVDAPAGTTITNTARVGGAHSSASGVVGAAPASPGGAAGGGSGTSAGSGPSAPPSPGGAAGAGPPPAGSVAHHHHHRQHPAPPGAGGQSAGASAAGAGKGAQPPAGSPTLAFTGLNLVPIVLGGLLLVLSGLGTLEVARRRRRLSGPRG